MNDWKLVAERLNQHLAKKRLSSRDVARKAGVDRKTVDRLRAGQAVRPTTLQWIEEALKIDLSGEDPARELDVAPLSHGGYRKQAVIDYAGRYTAYRRSFDTPGHLIASSLRITWDEAVPALRFDEEQDNRDRRGKAYRYRFAGEVLIPPNLGVMHFMVRSEDGRVRLISTSMPRQEYDTLVMKGFLMTLNEIRDIGYYPVASPIFLAKAQGTTAPATGVIDRDDDRYDWAMEVLADIEDKYLPWVADPA